jgi:nitrite reductase (NO-forming)
MARIEIASASERRGPSGRPLMSDHNLSARVWATAALIAVPAQSVFSIGWWLPVHLAMLGAASQAIVGGQLMFTTTLGLSRGPKRSQSLLQLSLMNIGAGLVVGGRVWDEQWLLAIGASVFVVTVGWVSLQVHLLWRRSINRRFAIAGTFYRLAGLSILFGASIGAALGIGAFDDPSSYVAHRGVHMTLNLLGWAGLTIVGTAVTLLPTILHVRAPQLRMVRATPWLMFGGLAVLSAGATLTQNVISLVGIAFYGLGLAGFAVYLRQVLSTARRRRVPTAALHVVAALSWLLVTTVVVAVSFGRGDASLTHDVLVVGGVVGFVFQALIGAWSFLLPSTRAPLPQRRRWELTAMEVGGRTQVVAFNLGLFIVAAGMWAEMNMSVVGIGLTWSAAAFAIAKSWTFPLLANMAFVRAYSDRWWTPLEA